MDFFSYDWIFKKIINSLTVALKIVYFSLILQHWPRVLTDGGDFG